MIEIEHLSKSFEGGRVVDDVSLSVGDGEIVAVVGTSGSGKTTLLRMINRLIEPDSGRVLIDGRDTHAGPAYVLRRQIGYAIQGHGLFPHRTVGQNIATVPGLLGWNRAKIGARVDELLTLFQLDPATYRDRLPGALSGGQQQRVGVARALAAAPKVLLMDEPFASVDAQTRAELEDLVLRVREQFGVTIVLVTHDIDEAVYMSDRVVVLSKPPSTVSEILPVELPSPRDQIESKALPEFATLRARVYETIMQAQPKAPAA